MLRCQLYPAIGKAYRGREAAKPCSLRKCPLLPARRAAVGALQSFFECRIVTVRPFNTSATPTEPYLGRCRGGGNVGPTYRRLHALPGT